MKIIAAYCYDTDTNTFSDPLDGLADMTVGDTSQRDLLLAVPTSEDGTVWHVEGDSPQGGQSFDFSVKRGQQTLPEIGIRAAAEWQAPPSSHHAHYGTTGATFVDSKGQARSTPGARSAPFQP